MNTIQTKVPKPIINEYYLRNGNGSHMTVGIPYRGDHFNLSTGECSVARVIGGVRYDTVRAALIASMSAIDEDTGTYRVKRLYRSMHGAYFVLNMQWSDEYGFPDPDFIQPISDESVMNVARFIIPPQDCFRFLNDWYCAGWIPRNDIDAQKWAESCLSADDCETVMVEFTNSIRRT